MNNKHWYTNGVEEIAIGIDETVPDGFHRGRKPIKEETRQKMSVSQKGHPIYRTSTNKGMTYSEQARKNMSDSKRKFFQENPDWVSPTAFVKGQISWNKGIPMREESKKKLSDATKGRPSAFKGRKHSNESKLKMSEKQKGKTVWNKGKTNCYSEDVIKKMSEARTGYKLSSDSLKLFKEHMYLTKKKNNSFNISKLEDRVYDKLINKFGKDDVIRQYRDNERYPFNCDFYIKSLDLFIECNFTWTHGKHFFDSESKEDMATLEEWKKKSVTSKYYKIAIDVWTKRDILKRDTMVKNGLNMFVAYKEEEINDFISKF